MNNPAPLTCALSEAVFIARAHVSSVFIARAHVSSVFIARAHVSSSSETSKVGLEGGKKLWPCVAAFSSWSCLLPAHHHHHHEHEHEHEHEVRPRAFATDTPPLEQASTRREGGGGRGGGQG